jgi:hypothetical protein
MQQSEMDLEHGPRQRTTIARIKFSVFVSLVIATCLSLIVLAISLATRTWYFEMYHASTWRIIGTYYTAALIIALPVGLLLPYARNRIVAGLLGAFGGALVYALVSYTASGTVDWFFAGGLGMCFGTLAALKIRAGILADKAKTTVKAQEASGPDGFGLGISLVIDEDHPVEKEMRIVNEYYINWLARRRTACRDLVMAFEAPPSEFEKIIAQCKLLLNQNLGMNEVVSKLEITVELINLHTGETKELNMKWSPPESAPKPPSVPPNDDTRYMPKQ